MVLEKQIWRQLSPSHGGSEHMIALVPSQTCLIREGRALHSQPPFNMPKPSMSLALSHQSVVRPLLWSQWIYWCIAGVSAWAYAAMPAGSIRSTLVLSPIAPGLLIVVLSHWLYMSGDEYIRFRILRAAATSAVAVAILAIVYFFLELLGFPRLSMMWVEIVGWSVFCGQMLRLMLIHPKRR